MKRLLAFAVMALLVSPPCFAQEPKEDEEMQKLKEDLSKLQEEHKRLDDLVKLKAEVARLKEEKRQLKDQLAGKKPPPPPEPPRPTLPVPRERWDLAGLTAAAPLKVVSVALHGTDEAAITLEFTKDIEPRDTLALNQAIRAERPLLSFWFIDRDRVAVHIATRFYIEGEITGRKGEAFRLVLKLPDYDVARRVNRVEVRGGM